MKLEDRWPRRFMLIVPPLVMLGAEPPDNEPSVWKVRIVVSLCRLPADFARLPLKISRKQSSGDCCMGLRLKVVGTVVHSCQIVPHPFVTGKKKSAQHPQVIHQQILDSEAAFRDALQ
jgi:hypothetical protein